MSEHSRDYLSDHLYENSSNYPSPKDSSSNSSGAERFKVIEQLIESDEDENRAKRLGQLQSTFPVLKRIIPSMSNKEKLNLFLKDNNFRHRLVAKLNSQAEKAKMPVLRLQIYTVRYCAHVSEEFDQADLQTVFERFGVIKELHVDKNVAYMRFDNFVSAYLALQTLNDFQIQTSLRIGIKWCTELDLKFLATLQIRNPTPNNDSYQKLVARYEIYLDVTNDFKLSQRIIGPSGIHMKKILAKAEEQCSKRDIPVESVAKIRLRGQGSGYKQSPEGLESDEILNLCVSSKDATIYKLICQEAEALLKKIIQDYKYYFQTRWKKQCEGVAYRLFECKHKHFLLTKQFNLQSVPSGYTLGLHSENRRLTEKEIIKIIQSRDRARRQGKFQEADRLRDQLKQQGICLIDGGNNRKVRTVWKYITQ